MLLVLLNTLHIHSVVLFGLISLQVSKQRFHESVVFFVVELVLIIVTSNHSPGLCVDMEGDVDIEKASLLSKEVPNGSKRGAICKSCGIKRPLRSCHCTEYVL